MQQTERIEHNFNGIRVQVKTSLPFDEVLKRLRELTGNAPLSELNAIGKSDISEHEFDREITARFVGKSGFMTFAEIDHGNWILRYGLKRRVLRLVVGNPLIAITMIRHDITAGLFAPIEILLVENEDNAGSELYYLLPSSVMVIEPNEQLALAAKKLDQKLELLISNISAVSAPVSVVETM